VSTGGRREPARGDRAPGGLSPRKRFTTKTRSPATRTTASAWIGASRMADGVRRADADGREEAGLEVGRDDDRLAAARRRRRDAASSRSRVRVRRAAPEPRAVARARPPRPAHADRHRPRCRRGRRRRPPRDGVCELAAAPHAIADRTRRLTSGGPRRARRRMCTRRPRRPSRVARRVAVAARDAERRSRSRRDPPRDETCRRTTRFAASSTSDDRDRPATAPHRSLRTRRTRSRRAPAPAAGSPSASWVRSSPTFFASSPTRSPRAAARPRRRRPCRSRLSTLRDVRAVEEVVGDEVRLVEDRPGQSRAATAERHVRRPRELDARRTPRRPAGRAAASREGSSRRRRRARAGACSSRAARARARDAPPTGSS
jgi:hypothetical protein